MSFTLEFISYHEWYNHPENDAYHGVYDTVFRLFNAVAQIDTPATIVQHVATDEDMKLAFVHLDPLGYVRVVHRIRRLAPQAGIPDPQNNLCIGLLGDVYRAGANFVELPPTAFHRTTPLERIPTPATLATMLEARPDATQFTVPADTPAEGLQPVRSRFLMLIPPMLVGKVLYASISPGGLNPRQLWTEIAAPLYEDDFYRNDCTPFFDWCRIAVAGGERANNPLQSPFPTPVDPGDRLDRERFAMLRRELPRLFDPTPSAPPPNFVLPPVTLPEANFGQIVEVLQNLHSDYVTRADAATACEEIRRDRPPPVITPLARWDEALDDLLLICQVANADQLPPLWAAMARQGVKLDRRTLQTHVNRKDARYKESGEIALPIHISIDLAADLGTLRFAADKASYIGVGLSIFMVSYPTVGAVDCLRKSVELFDRQMDTIASLTLDEARKLRNGQRFTLPTNYLGVEQVCRAYLRLLAATLGFDHPITCAFEPFIVHLVDQRMFLTEYLERDVKRCAGILRHIQIAVHYCLQALQAKKAATLPDFMCIFPQMQRDSWIPTSIPNVTTNVAVAAPPVARNPVPAPAQTTAVVYVHAPSGYINRAVIPIIPNFNPTACMAQRGNPPFNKDGCRMCLRYQVIGFCVANCTRTQDHKKHTPSENTQLAAYLAKTKP
jgi:hypothetical protein